MMAGKILHWILVILLTLLKIIGWILLILLLLIVLILLIICLCPLRYQLQAKVEKKIKTSSGGGEVTWLGGLLRGGAVYKDGKLSPYVKILWITKNLGESDEETSTPEEEKAVEQLLNEIEEDKDVPEEKTEEKTVEGTPQEPDENPEAEEAPDVSDAEPLGEAAETDIEAAEEEAAETDTEAAEEEAAETDTEPAVEEAAETDTEPAVEEAAETDTEPAVEEAAETDTEPAEESRTVDDEAFEEDAEEEESPEASPQVKSILEMLEIAWNKLLAIGDRITQTGTKLSRKYTDLKEKLQKLKAKADPVLAEIKDPQNQKAVKHALAEIFGLLGKLLPRRMNADLAYSLGSPDLTGEVYGIFYMIPEAYRGEWQVEPDFQSEAFYAEGDLSFEGAFRIGSIVEALFRLAIDRSVWHLVKRVLKLRKK